jgi:sulfur carrier protein
MQIKVNGESRSFGSRLSVAGLAEQLALDPRQVAVERNREIVPRSRYGEVMLSDGDEIEIVRFIGGG